MKKAKQKAINIWFVLSRFPWFVPVSPIIRALTQLNKPETWIPWSRPLPENLGCKFTSVRKIGDSYETWITHTRFVSTDYVQLDGIFKAGEPFLVVNRTPIEINRPLALRGHVTSFLWKWKLHDFAFETLLVGHLLNKIIVLWFFKPAPFV